MIWIKYLRDLCALCGEKNLVILCPCWFKALSVLNVFGIKKHPKNGWYVYDGVAEEKI